MEVFLERLLLELLVIVAQLAVIRIISWLRNRSTGPDAGEGSVTLAAA